MRAQVIEESRPQCSLQTLCESMHGNANAGPPSLGMSLPVCMDGSQLGLHNELHSMLHVRAVAGQDGAVEGNVALWPWASLLQSGFVKVLSTHDSDISRYVYFCY